MSAANQSVERGINPPDYVTDAQAITYPGDILGFVDIDTRRIKPNNLRLDSAELIRDLFRLKSKAVCVQDAGIQRKSIAAGQYDPQLTPRRLCASQIVWPKSFRNGCLVVEVKV